ncbi:pectinesterase precursor [Colletotrichum tofieldiae]|uniref:Pectinesterase n=1 Tax=Colletotrichum tofieldiae TaxID=708197 RepID=A0A166X9M1_9PEZI|nr:pectinesterase precursor [Colletotrichum tofieldiae]GKT96176.1 pectinesterase precursor [Colletotrichum tofieldiae]
MTPRRPHLELFNPALPKTDHRRFTIFAKLPTEIRLLIWKHALQRHRMLYVVLETQAKRGAGTKAKAAERYSLLNALGRSVSGTHYNVVVLNRHALLPENIAMVNKEARGTVLAFYSVQIPCHHKPIVDSKSKLRPPKHVLRLNLDWDYLRVSAENAFLLFFDFLHDLRAYDPQGRGLQHLVMEDSCFRIAEVSSLSSTHLDARALAAFTATLTNLKTIWFKSTPHDGRALDVLTWMSVNAFNYSFPVFPTFTFFDPPLPDPRNISRDLQRVGGSVSDWRERPLGWRLLLRKFGIRPEDVEGSPDVDVRMMIATSREEDIRTREDAARVLHEEDFDWLRLQWWFRGWDSPQPGGGGDRPAGCFTTASGMRPGLPEIDGPEVLAAAPRPALGFWLFPVEAFGEICEDKDPSLWTRSRGIFDLSSHWPDLALVDVP